MTKVSFLTPISVLAFITACSGGGDSTDSSITSADTDWAAVSDVVNGYRLVRRTTYDEFDNELSRLDLEIDYEQSMVSSALSYYASDFDSEPTITRRTSYFDQQGRLVRSSNGDEVKFFEFNSDGLLSRTYEVKSYGPREERTMEYDHQNRIQRSLSVHRIRDDVVERTVFEYEYDNQGFISRRYVDKNINQMKTAEGTFQNVVETSVSIYTVDVLGRVVRKETDVTTDSRLSFPPYTEVRTYEYDHHGNMVLSTVSIHSFIERRVYEYERIEKPVFNRFLRIFKYFP